MRRASWTPCWRQRALRREAVEHYLYHPGGVRVLEAYQEAYGVGRDVLRHSWAVLRCYGNMSSATVFFVIERFLESGGREAYGVISALGPGFSFRIGAGA